MPSLAGLFGRKKRQGATSDVTRDFDSTQSSPIAEYVTPDRSLPSSPNGKTNLAPESTFEGQPSNVYPSLAASSNKLRLPFSRKKPAATASTSSIVTDDQHANFGIPPRPSYMSPRNSTSAASDSDVDVRRLRPPPSKSAIFAAYADPHSALSTRSLPNEHSPQREAVPVVPPVPAKRSFLNWSKSSPKTATRSGPTPAPPSDIDSFNLKSFRHISSSPNTSSPKVSKPSLAPPAIPRPRGSSTASDASQRISVAAFREAQARRSTAGSPVPSNRAPSPLPSAILRSSQQPLRHTRSDLAYASGSDVQSSEDDDSDEASVSQHARHLRQGADVVRRQRTLTQRTDTEVRGAIRGRATKSEMGHGSTSIAPSIKRDSNSSFAFMSQSYALQNGGKDAMPRSQSNLGIHAGSRQRASVSTSAISPTAAAKRASIIASANAHSNGRHHVRASSTKSDPAAPADLIPSPSRVSSSSSDDSDDAPLATLVPPRRPVSSMSSNNGSTRSVHAPKPLIDINELTKSRPVTAKTVSNDGFTPGATLLGGRGMSTNSTPPSASPIYKSPIPTSVDPPTKFVSPPSSPRQESMQLKSSIPAPSSAPLRSSTGFLHSTPGPVSVSERRETSPDGQRRDPFGERLNRVVQLKAGSWSSAASSTLPTSAPESVLGTPLTTSPTASVLTFKPVPPLPRATSPSPPHSHTVAHSKRETPQPSKLSPPDEELANMLGGGISLISRTGESEESESESDEDEDDETDEDTTRVVDQNRIAPIPIKERAPPPAFSVTSRPPLRRSGEQERSAGGDASARSSVFSVGKGSVVDVPLLSPNENGSGSGGRGGVLVPSPTSSASGKPSTAKPLGPGMGKKGGILRDGYNSNSAAGSSNDSEKSEGPPVVGVKATASGRQRSSTMLPNLVSATPPGSTAPTRPFVGVGGGRRERESPASSTGDSSSGRAPFTPKDGSDIGVGRGENDSGWNSGVSGLGGPGGKHFKRRSVSFEDDLRMDGDGAKAKAPLGDEQRRRERRRSEAKAAIELGNVINGRGPIVDDDEDDLPINQTLTGGPRMSMMSPMMNPMGMGFGTPMSGSWTNLGMTANMRGWPPQQAPQNPHLLSPAQFMPPMPADPTYMAAHQQAMMFAKQAYQMAVAQQAMAAAADEWERGSSIGGFGGGGGSVYGGGGGGGGGGSPMMGPPFGMMGMGMGGMGMQGANGWSSGSVIFPASSRSAYGGARSDYGGGGRGGAGQWSSSKSSYGESFGPSNRHNKVSQRDSGLYPPVPPIPQGKNGGSSVQSSPRSRTASQPASPARGVRRAPPPSSWKAGV